MRLDETRKAYLTATIRESIAEAVGSVLEHYGVRYLTMDRVASVAGVAKGSLYTYFENKKELMQFIYNRLVEPFLQTIEAIADGDKAAPQKLAAILRVALKHTKEHQGLIRLLIDLDCGDDLEKSARSRLMRSIMSVFEQGIKDNHFRPHDHSHSARMYHGGLTELFELQLSGASDDEVKRFSIMLADVTINHITIYDRADQSDV